MSELVAVNTEQAGSVLGYAIRSRYRCKQLPNKHWRRVRAALPLILICLNCLQVFLAVPHDLSESLA